MSAALALGACGRVGFDPPGPQPGAVLLARSFGGAGSDTPYAVAVDPVGNIIIVGALVGSDIDFGCAQHAASQAAVDAFVVKLDPTGACKWVVPFTGSKDDQITGVAVSPDGTVFVAGSTSSSSPQLGTYVIATTPGVHQGLFARLDATTGNVDYVRRWGGAADAFGGAISITGSGNVVVGGWWSKASATEAITVPGRSGALTIGSPDTLQQYGIVAVYDQAGEPQWGRVVKTDGPVSVFQVAGDANDDILLAGSFVSVNGIDEFGYPGGGMPVLPQITPDGSEAVFYMKITGTGTPGAPVWAKAWGSTVSDIEPTSIAVDPSGNNAVAFYAFESQDLGAGRQAFAGGTGTDIAIGGYRPDGSYRFGTMSGGPGSDFVDDIVFSASGDGFFTGAISSPVDFGGGSLDGFGGRDLFVAALDRNGAHRWAVSYGSSSDDNGVGVALGPQGLVVVAGIGGTLDVGDHHLVNAGSSDILLLVLRP